MNKPVQVGITGGIGSGKSTAARMFSVLGIPIYDADSRAKYLMSYDENVKNEIIDLFGADAYIDNNVLNRQHIASIAFKNKKILAQLNAIVHPAVDKDYNTWVNEHSQFPILLKEAALLIEAESYKKLDKLIVIIAPLEIRMNRVVQRDHTQKSRVEDRIKNQMTDEERLPFADFVIINDGQKKLSTQVWKIYQELKQLANCHS